MTPRKLHAQPIYLEPEKAFLLGELSAEARIAKAVLLRDVVDDLLVNHCKLQPAAVASPEECCASYVCPDELYPANEVIESERDRTCRSASAP